MTSDIMKAVQQAIREPYAWPGGYPVHVVLSDGDLLCTQCARAEYRQLSEADRDQGRTGWEPIGAEIFWEGEESCGHCGTTIESAYGPVA